VAYFVLPGYRVLGSQIFINALFALSIDLILGYAGIVSLGHAAFFGLGAYTAGLLALHGWNEPLTGVLLAALVAATAGFLTSFLVVRGHELSRLMVTLGVGLLFYEAANKAAVVTGGVDGLSGIVMGKMFGRFSFDIGGTTAYWYSLLVTFALFALCKRMLSSPFGLSLRGIREGSARMPAIGAPVRRRLVAVFTLSAALAGIAGALLTQTTEFVGLEVLGFPRSAQALIMVVLGGAGQMYGGLVGAAVFLFLQDILSGLNPVYWQFWLGLLLIALVLIARGGILGAVRMLRRGEAAASGAIKADPVARLGNPPRIELDIPAGATLKAVNVSKNWGRLQANKDLSLTFPPGARHALIGPNGAGKTTFVNLLTGVHRPSSGDVYLDGERITHLAQHERVKRGMARTFQINTLFGDLTVLESVVLAILERRGEGHLGHVTVARRHEPRREAEGLLRTLRLEREAAVPTRVLPYGKQRLLEIALALATRPKILILDEPAAGIPADDVTEVFNVIAALPPNVTVLFIEHDIKLVFRFARSITVLAAGQVLAEGTPQEIATDRRVREVYLGETSWIGDDWKAAP
jgi:branched-chain amino acid transport system permease protein